MKLTTAVSLFSLLAFFPGALAFGPTSTYNTLTRADDHNPGRNLISFTELNVEKPISSSLSFTPKARVGNWLPRDVYDMEYYLTQLSKSGLDARLAERPLIDPIKDMKDLVEGDIVLKSNFDQMFIDAQEKTPLGTPPIKDFDHFLHMLNLIIRTSPAFYTKGKNNFDAAGLIAFPINALLDFPMSTDSGYAIFSNALINQQFKKILSHWTTFLESEESAYVLGTIEDNVLGANLIPWLDDKAKDQVVKVAFKWNGRKGVPCNTKYEDVFKTLPHERNEGYKSWDEFFTKEFVDGVRPIGGPKPLWLDSDRVVLNACESAPLQFTRNAKLDEKFWVKEQPYSIRNILDSDKRAEQFDGGTIYQAFLSGLSYHRWHSPVSGTIVKTKVVSGSYYLENINVKDDTSAPNESQRFLTAVASRGLIFIEADGPIGLMCFVAVGMSEVSSCDIKVQPGQRVEKGEQIGMFHYGGSSHCLLFRDNVDLEYEQIACNYNTGGFNVNSTNVPVKAQLFRVKDETTDSF